MGYLLLKGTSLQQGRFFVRKVLGEGRFGITYLGQDNLLHRPVAIKELFIKDCCFRQGRSVIPSSSITHIDYQNYKASFIEEAKTLARFQHPNIVNVYNYFEENNTAYMVMEFLQGKTLLKLVEERGVLPEKKALAYIKQVAKALSVVHQACILHPDIISPDNIMVTDNDRAVLIDFGTARAFVAGKRQQMTKIWKPGYSPLEQYGSKARVGPYTDIYALGGTLYYLLTGKVPVAWPDRVAGVELSSVQKLNPKVSEKTSQAVMQVMAMPVAKRPQSVEDFLNLLFRSQYVHSKPLKLPLPKQLSLYVPPKPLKLPPPKPLKLPPPKQRNWDKQLKEFRLPPPVPPPRDPKEHYAFGLATITGTRPLPRVYIHADMDEQVIINHTTTIDVILSRKLHDWLESDTAKTSAVEIEEKKKLLIQVIPKTNFQVINEDRIEVEPPIPDKPHHFYFDIKATQLGKGEVWVVARQGQIPLTTLKLRPQIVESREDILALQKTSQTTGISNIPVLREPLHQLYIIEQREGEKISYQYELLSPSLNLLNYYQSKQIISNRNEYVKQLYDQIESRWVNSQDDIKAFAAELRAFGGELFDELFPHELQETLWKHHEELNSIMVISTEPFIPWELVHLKPAGQKHLPEETMFLGQMGLIRWLYDVGWPPTQIKIRPHRVYYVIPHYPVDKYKLPEAEQELQFLEERLKATPVAPQPNPVRNLISKPGAFDLLHFAGHGFVEEGEIIHAKLMLEGRREGQHYIPAHLISTTVSQFSQLEANDNRPMIVLNACQVGRAGYTLTGISSFAQAFLEGGAGAFVGPLWSVGDKPARIFTETLYCNLLDGQNLAQATQNARKQAQKAGDATWLAYAVYGHPDLKVQYNQAQSNNSRSFKVGDRTHLGSIGGDFKPHAFPIIMSDHVKSTAVAPEKNPEQNESKITKILGIAAIAGIIGAIAAILILF